MTDHSNQPARSWTYCELPPNWASYSLHYQCTNLWSFLHCCSRIYCRVDPCYPSKFPTRDPYIALCWAKHHWHGRTGLRLQTHDGWKHNSDTTESYHLHTEKSQTPPGSQAKVHQICHDDIWLTERTVLWKVHIAMGIGHIPDEHFYWLERDPICSR